MLRDISGGPSYLFFQAPLSWILQNRVRSKMVLPKFHRISVSLSWLLWDFWDPRWLCPNSTRFGHYHLESHEILQDLAIFDHEISNSDTWLSQEVVTQENWESLLYLQNYTIIKDCLITKSSYVEIFKWEKMKKWNSDSPQRGYNIFLASLDILATHFDSALKKISHCKKENQYTVSNIDSHSFIVCDRKIHSTFE